MTEPYIYCGKALSDYSLWELFGIQSSLNIAERKREEAAKHPKFDKSHKKYIGEFPPPNPEFLKLKNEIELEIKKRNTNA